MSDHTQAALTYYSDILDTVERARLAAENRIGAWEREGIEVDGAMREVLTQLAATEDAVGKQLDRTVHSHPLYLFIAQTVGLGDRTGARLLAAVGDPLTRPAIIDRDSKEVLAPARPRRGVAEFWQYCGHGDPERSKRRKGQRIEYNPRAKMRAHLCAEACHMFDGKPDKNGKGRARSPYRDVVDARRGHTASTHPEWTPKHSLNDGIHVAAKALLRDLFLFARGQSDQPSILAGGHTCDKLPESIPPTQPKSVASRATSSTPAIPEPDSIFVTPESKALTGAMA